MYSNLHQQKKSPPRNLKKTHKKNPVISHWIYKSIRSELESKQFYQFTTNFSTLESPN